MDSLSPQHEVTQLLADLEAGRPEAERQLLPLVYDELRRVAAGYMRRERPGHTLQATAPASHGATEPISSPLRPN
jgi:hypothetical protein